MMLYWDLGHAQLFMSARMTKNQKLIFWPNHIMFGYYSHYKLTKDAFPIVYSDLRWWGLEIWVTPTFSWACVCGQKSKMNVCPNRNIFGRYSLSKLSKKAFSREGWELRVSWGPRQERAMPGVHRKKWWIEGGRRRGRNGIYYMGRGDWRRSIREAGGVMRW